MDIELTSCAHRTKIQIAERIFYFVLPTIEPPAQAEPATAAPNGINAGAANESSDDDDDDEQDDDGDSSSLSEMSDSAIELSPLLNPVTVVPSPAPAPAPLPVLAPAPEPSPAPSSAPSLVPAAVRKTEKKPRASTSASAVAGPSNPQLLALAPPVRAASRNVNYGGATSGKRIEVLQAVRSAKGAGKGKSAAMGAGKMGGGRGKGKMGKGKSILPTKKPRTQSFGSSPGDDDDEVDSDDSDDDDVHGDEAFMTEIGRASCRERVS